MDLRLRRDGQAHGSIPVTPITCAERIVVIVSPYSAKPYATISLKTLDTACIIKEEPNSAQRRVPPCRNRTWSLSHHLAAAWGNEQMHRHQKCAHSCGLIRHTDISNRADCVSRFESKSFLENILESNAGGRGSPPQGMAPVSVSTCAHFLWPYPAHDISNRTDCVSRFESKSFRENILESNAGGRGACIS